MRVLAPLKMMKNTIVISSVLAVPLLLSSCAATQMAIQHRNLEVQTKNSATVFLDPVPKREKVVYVQVKNTSDQSEVKLKPQLTALLKQKGYRVTHELNQAHYLLQVNILQVGKSSVSAAQAALGGGFGSSLGGAAVGAGLGAVIAPNTAGIVGGGIAGGLLSTVTDSLVKDVVFSMITDVQIAERSHGKIHERDREVLTQGTSGAVVQQREGSTDWQRYRTRIVSQAEKVNLTFKTALPELQKALAKSLSEIFE